MARSAASVKKVEHGAVVPHGPGPFGGPGQQVGVDPGDGGVVTETLSGQIECSLGHVEDREVGVASGDQRIDEPGRATAHVDHRVGGDDLGPVEQLERGRGLGLEPAHVLGADLDVAAVPVTLALVWTGRGIVHARAIRRRRGYRSEEWSATSAYSRGRSVPSLDSASLSAHSA